MPPEDFPSVWFRIVKRDREGHEEVLRSWMGRFHLPASPPTSSTSYAADTLHTAWAEVSAHLGVPANPKAFRAWRIRLSAGTRLLDLRDPGVQQAHRISSTELRADPPPAECMALADRVRRSGEWQGMIYSSVRRSEGTCLVLFLERADFELEPIAEHQWGEGARSGR